MTGNGEATAIDPAGGSDELIPADVLCDHMARLGVIIEDAPQAVLQDDKVYAVASWLRDLLDTRCSTTAHHRRMADPVISTEAP